MRELSDDEVFGQSTKQELSDDEVFGTSMPATQNAVAPRSFLGRLASDIAGIFGRSKSVLETEPVQTNQGFDFNTASRVARAIDDGVPLPLPRTIQGDQAAAATAAEKEAERRAGQNRRRFAYENPTTAGLAAGSAQALTGLANAPFVAADAVNNLTVNPILRLFGADPLPAARAPGTETLRGLAADYTADVSKSGLGDAWDGDQFGTWLMSNLAQQAPQMAQSLAAAYFPALRPMLLPAMGAQAAGSSFAEGDHSGVAALKGGIETASEMLPLGVFDKVSAMLSTLPDGVRRTVWNEAARRVAASGAALTANSLTGAIEEAVAQVGGNAADRYLSGKNVGLFEDVPKAAVLGAAGGTALTTPQAVGTLLQREEKAPADAGPTPEDYQALMARVFGQAPAARVPQPAAPESQPAAPQPEPQAEPQPSADRQAIDTILGAIEAAVPTQQAPAAQPEQQPVELSDEEVMGTQAANTQADATAPDGERVQPASTDYTLPAGRIDNRAAPDQQAQADEPLGADFTPMSQGGKPFKTDREAKAARKLQPHLRTVKSKDGNGWVLVPKTAKQLAAEAQAAKRIKGVKTGNAGKPMSAHEFVMSKGGMDGSARRDLVVDGNPRFGNRFLFAGKGKPGLTLARAAELLAEAGYIKDESETAAADIIKRSITSPQYTAEGWERIAQAEADARFEDFANAQVEAGDPLVLDDADLAELQGAGQEYDQADLQALIDQAEAMGIDADSLLEDSARITQNGTQDEYLATARQSLSGAIQGAAGGRGPQEADGNAGQRQQPAQAQRGDGAGGGQGDGRPRDARAEGQDEGLTSYTPDELRQRVERLEQAERERQQQDREAEQRAKADAERDDFTLTGSDREADQAASRGQGGLFDGGMVRDGATAYADQTSTQQFKRWSKGAPVVRMGDDEHVFQGGEPVVVEALHGTTADLTEFKAERANIESDLGGGFYFTNTPDDVGANYAGKGPDLTNKLDQATERLEQELADDPDWEDKSAEEIRAEAERQARTRWMDHDGMTMPVFVRFDNPVVIGGDGATKLTYSEPYNEELDEYGEPEGTLVEFVDALRYVASDFIDASPDEAMLKVWEEIDGEGEIDAGKLIDILAQSEGLSSAMNEDGASASKEILRLTFERMGFDGFIDTTAYDKFGPRKIKGAYGAGIKVAGMQGMYRETVHFIAFNPTQIKSRLGNNGEFNPDDANITRERDTGQADLFNQQLDLFLDGKPVETQAGPEVEAARKAAADALRDIRDMGNPLAMALSTDLAARQRVSLVGQTARTPEEFATLAQVYRDPRFETFRVVFTNDAGKIVSQVGLTMRMPGATTVIVGKDMDTYLDPLMAAAKNRGATGYYLLHNHPSGNPVPSRADEQVTRAYAQRSQAMGGPKFKGHVVIDTNKYTLIDKNGNWNIEHKDFGQPAPYGGNEWAGEAITGPDDVMRMVKRLQVDNSTVALIVTNYQHTVLGVTSIPASALSQDKARNRLVIAKATLGIKGAKVIAVGRNFETLRATSGIALDAVQVFSDGNVTSLVQDGSMRSGEVIDRSRGTRVSPDTSPEFAYLREEALKERNQANRASGKVRESDPGMDQTQTPAFKKWFGDSKVVDDQGKPLVVYHGSPDSGIKFFDASKEGKNTGSATEDHALGGFYFTADPNVADTYARTHEVEMANTAEQEFGIKPKGYLPSSTTYPVYLSLQNPAELRIPVSRSALSMARDAGHDGAILRGRGGVVEYVAFRPEQIKSAIGNNGNFDPNDASIVREDEPADLWADRDAEQKALDLGAAVNKTYDPDKFKARDLLGFERDASGRRVWTAGRKGYDAGMSLARAALGKVKLMDTKPGDFRAMMRKYQADNFNAQQRALEIAKAGQDMPPEMRSLLSDIIEKEVAVGDNTPEGLTEIAASMSAAFERQAQELIELGMMDKDRKVANYLPRVYRNPLIGKLQSREQMLGMLNKVRMKIRGDRLKSRGLTTQVPPGRVKDMERLGWKLSSMPDGSPVPVDLRTSIEKGKPLPGRFSENQKVMMWRDFTKTERQEMGEVRDAFIRFAMGYVETQKDLALGRLFKAISENRKLSSQFNPGGWVKVSDKEVFGSNGLKMYGALAGMYVEPQVADQLKRAIQDNSAVMQAYDKALSLWKEGKTVWNPVAHGNNVVSNLFMAHFAGINIANPKVWRTALKEYRSKGKLYQESVENGLLGTEFANTEIQNALMPELKEFMSEADVAASRVTKMAEFLKRYPGRPVSWYREKMQNAYEFEDQIFKLMVYIDRRQAGAEPGAAVDDAERYFFNYSDVPEGIRSVQRFWSPFFSYTYNALPAVLYTAATRPDRLLMPMALLGGANWLAYALLGDDGDEEEERKNMPDYMKGNTALGSPKMVRLPTNSKEGNPYFLDMSRRIPLGDIFDLNNQMGGIPLLQPFMPSHPVLWSVPLAIVGNKDNFTGRELVKKSDTEWEAARKRAGYLYRQIVPNAPFVPGSYAWDKAAQGTASAFDAQLGPYTGFSNQGDKAKPWVAALDVTGVAKVRESNTERNKDFKMMDLRKEAQEISANMRSLGRSVRNGAITRKDYDEQVADQRKKLEVLREKMAEAR